jgi:cytochrome c556
MPRPVLPSLFCALALVFLNGCGKPSHESVMKDMISKMNELGTVLKGVTDEASAKAAGAKIKTISEDMKKIKAEADALPTPTAEEDKKLKEAHEKELTDAMGTMSTEMMRIMMDPKLSAPMTDAMKELRTSMMEGKKR